MPVAASPCSPGRRDDGQEAVGLGATDGDADGVIDGEAAGLPDAPGLDDGPALGTPVGASVAIGVGVASG